MTTEKAIEILSEVRLCSPLGQAAFVAIGALQEQQTRKRRTTTAEHGRPYALGQKIERPEDVDLGHMLVTIIFNTTGRDMAEQGVFDIGKTLGDIGVDKHSGVVTVIAEASLWGVVFLYGSCGDYWVVHGITNGYA